MNDPLPETADAAVAEDAAQRSPPDAAESMAVVPGDSVPPEPKTTAEEGSPPMPADLPAAPESGASSPASEGPAGSVPPGAPAAASDEPPARRASGDSALLLARARDLARETPIVDSGEGATIEVLEFGLAGETHAFELAYIREAGALLELTPLPGVPDFVLGVTCVHGQIVAVVDLRKVFGLPERGLRDSRQVIILQSADMELGVLAERILGVRRLPSSALQTSLPTLTDVRAAYLKGITADGTVVLSAAKLLADPNLVVQEGAQGIDSSRPRQASLSNL